MPRKRREAPWKVLDATTPSVVYPSLGSHPARQAVGVAAEVTADCHTSRVQRMISLGPPDGQGRNADDQEGQIQKLQRTLAHL